MVLAYDDTLDIATGKSRKETRWKNKDWMWSDLVDKLSETTRTAETIAEYNAQKKSRQDEIKDIGGFVGGYLNNGVRKLSHVAHRQLITLDLDQAKPDAWDKFKEKFPVASCVYSTHKHTAAHPRFRFVIPLDRPVFNDEYVAICRKIAGIIDIEQFDPTGFRVHQLMYWPSTSKDGEFFFDYQDAEWLSADNILAMYTNWKDSSEWPVSDRYTAAVTREIKKQGNPLDKAGVVGAFCRTHTIYSAIDAYLADTYSECDIENRYTYNEGSTVAGLIVYDDCFAYSHHGTDPTSGKLCNAFDLVRLHKFGLMDEDAKEGTPGNKLPSYKAMLDFATKDVEVRKLLGRERLEAARNDFEGIELPEDDESADVRAPEEQNDEWLGTMETDKAGNYFSTINNIVNIFNNDPYLRGRIALNQFEDREVAIKDLPWRKVTKSTQYLTDRDEAHIRHYLEKMYGIASPNKIRDAIEIILTQNAFHPIRDYLKALQWDEIERLDTMLIDYFGAEDSEYTLAVTRKTFVAAVARIFQPGIKFETMLVLVGEQGIGKSTLPRRLAGEYFTDSLTDLRGKDAYELLQGAWIVEMAELAGLKKSEVEEIKNFLGIQVDKYRKAYGHRTGNHPRQNIFIGSTNDRNFLKDYTGNRRFWPVDTGLVRPMLNVFNIDDRTRDQIWAEAMYRYNQGEQIYLTGEALIQAKAKQLEHLEQDDRQGMIIKYLNTKLPAEWNDMDLYERRAYLNDDERIAAEGTVRRWKVSIAEIWCEVMIAQLKDMNGMNTKQLHNVMRTIPGWEIYRGSSTGKMRFGKMYGIQRAYVNTENWVEADTSERE